MDVSFDYCLDIITVDGVVYNLDHLRGYLISTYPNLVNRHRIRIINKGLWTFDWVEIFIIARDMRYPISQFIKQERGPAGSRDF